MDRITRRDFGRACLGAATVGGIAVGQKNAGREGLTVLGKVAPRNSAAIAASPLSVGFETLDRRLFDPERTYGHLARLGVKWARVHTGWCRTEHVRGQFDFAWLDAVVDSLRKIGIQPWFCVGFGNRLYTPQAPNESAVGWMPTGAPVGREAWLRYVGRLAEHYRGRVRHFEIWNEPNGKTFWKPGLPDPAQYADFVKLTAPAIRQRVPEAVIVGGAIAGMDTKFFQAAMEAGLGQAIQKASFHSYRFLPEKNYEQDVRQWRKIIARHRPGIGLWHGEVGAASQPGGAGGRANYPWTETRQAKWLLRRFVSDLRMEIELVSYFHTVDLVNYVASEGPTGKTNYKGLLRGTDYSPKPAYFAYQCLSALFDSEAVRADLRMEFTRSPIAEEIVSAGFTREGKAMYAYWHPPGPEMERPDETIDLGVPIRPGAQLSAPVLVDPLSATIYRADRCEKRGDCWQIPAAPLADHPLILTDRTLVLPS
jgi:polysaccharide biosynthesis protein PslG